MQNAGSSMALSVVGAFLGMTVFNSVMLYANVNQWLDGAFTGFVMAAFVTTSTFNEAIFDKPEGQIDRFKNWLIGFGFYMISYILAGVVMAVWQ